MDTVQSPSSKFGGAKVAWIVAIIVLVGVIVALNRVGSNGSDADKQDAALTEAETEEAVETSSAAKLVTEVDSDATLPYTAALTKYGSRRLQFNSRCQATVQSAEFTDGTKVMIDNRSSIAHRIVIGDKAFQIPAYDFAFVTLTAETFPTTYAVDCGDNKGAMSVTVTK